MPSNYSNRIFHDAERARVWLEGRLWPDGAVCPKCGVVCQATLMKGATTRAGLYQCNACRAPFTVTVGTIYERSHVPLNKWLGATYLLMASKKGMSALQIGRMIGVTYKTAWFMCHRIRESRRGGHPGPLGGSGMVVEADETYAGGSDKNRHAHKRQGVRGSSQKEPVVALSVAGESAASMFTTSIQRPCVRSSLSKSTLTRT